MPIKITFGATPDDVPAETVAEPEEQSPQPEQQPEEKKNGAGSFRNGFYPAFIDGLVFNNLTLVNFIGLTPIIAGGSTVFNGFVLSAATIIVLVAITLFAATVGRKIPEKLAPAVYTLLSAVLVAAMAFAGYALFPGVMLALGIVFPLVAVNGITLNRVRNFAGRSLPATVGDALGKGLGFAIVMFVVSTLREILGYGSFCNLRVPFFADHCAGVIAGVSGGFFFVAILAWVTKLIAVRFGPNTGKKEGKDR